MPLPFEPPPLEPPPLEPLPEPEPLPVCDPDPWEALGAGGASVCDPPPADPVTEPELCGAVDAGGLGLLGGLAGVLGTGVAFRLPSVRGFELVDAVVSVWLGAGWLGTLAATAFVFTGAVAELGFDVLARTRL